MSSTERNMNVGRRISGVNETRLGTLESQASNRHALERYLFPWRFRRKGVLGISISINQRVLPTTASTSRQGQRSSAILAAYVTAVAITILITIPIMTRRLEDLIGDRDSRIHGLVERVGSLRVGHSLPVGRVEERKGVGLPAQHTSEVKDGPGETYQIGDGGREPARGGDKMSFHPEPQLPADATCMILCVLPPQPLPSEIQPLIDGFDRHVGNKPSAALVLLTFEPWERTAANHSSRVMLLRYLVDGSDSKGETALR